MKKSTATPLPVSKKAYNRFIERINIVITDTDKRAAMAKALDSYLSGDRTDYAAPLSSECAMVFEMLRFEIDQAITRSERARTRALARKAQTIIAKDQPMAEITPTSQLSEEDLDKLREISRMIADAIREETEYEEEADSCGAHNDNLLSKPQPSVAPLTRRQRRDRQRRAHPKMRWQKLQP